MKKPEIEKKLMPLLDIIFLLLCMFIILPHGIKSNERLEIQALKQKNQQATRELEYYQWQYGSTKAISNRYYEVGILTFRNNELWSGGEMIPENKWRERLRRNIFEANINFVIVHIPKDEDIDTEKGRGLEAVLQEWYIPCIFTNSLFK